MKRGIVLFLIFIFIACGDSSDTGNETIITFSALCDSSGEVVNVIDIIDGDTIDVKFADGNTERVRYIGINTPETGEKCSSEATDYNKKLVGNKEIKLIQDVSDRDKYNRLLRYVCVDNNIFVNGQLISSGYAEAVAYPPDTKYADYLESLEIDANNVNRGCLWLGGGDGGRGDGYSGCCKVCKKGKACGDSCISINKKCTQPPGCACNG